MSLLDTYSIVKELISSGVNEKQAEIITRAINQSNNNLVNRADFQNLIIELKSEISKANLALHNHVNWKKLIAFYIIGFLIKIAILSGIWAIWICT